MIVKRGEGGGTAGKRFALQQKRSGTPLENENSDFWSERNQLGWMIHLKMEVSQEMDLQGQDRTADAQTTVRDEVREAG